MYTIPVYKIEKESGLLEKIRTSACIAYYQQLQLAPEFADRLAVKASKLKPPSGYTKSTNVGQIDLHYLKSILVSSVWNKNDDVFDRVEVWLAKNTPEDKPVNYEHSMTDIIGHMTDCWPIDDKGNIIADEIAVDELPPVYHIVDASVLYKCWPTEELQERIDKIIAEIPEGKWFVSMEAYFNNFDYAIIAKDGTQKVIARNDNTAFLTKHLRAYGGDGVFQELRVGRLLRNIVFSGKGIVKRPANEASVFILDTVAFTGVQADEKILGYPLKSDNNKESKVMATETDFQKQLDELRAENLKLQAAVKENESKNWQSKVDTLTEQVTARDKKVGELEAQVKSQAEALNAANKRAEDSEKKFSETQVELEKVRSEEVKRSRAVQWIDRTGSSLEDATKAVSRVWVIKLDADEFKELLESQPAKAKKEEPVTPPPPSPANDKQGKANADTTILDNVQKNNDGAPLGTDTNTDSGVETVKTSIAGFLRENYLSKGGKRGSSDNNDEER